MKKTNIIVIIIIIFFIILYLAKIAYFNTEINKLYKTIDRMQEKIDVISDELFVTKGILDGHITGELSKDAGGEQ